MRIAILSINIGAYDIFWSDFYSSAEENFICDCLEKEYFVFTDSTDIKAEKDKVHVYYQEDMGWPNNTMKRFMFIYNIKDELQNFDYIFFVNANALFQEKLTSDFINRRKNIIVIEHPGFHLYKPEDKPFETREESFAFVHEKDRRMYVQGAFYGGKTDYFLQMVDFLNKRTEEDLERGRIAVWHDESFLNAYVAGRNDVQILGWQYLYFDEYVLPYARTIVLRDKRKYLTNKNGRFLNENFFKKRMLIKLRNLKWKILIFLKVYKYESIKDSEGNYIGNNIQSIFEDP